MLVRMWPASIEKMQFLLGCSEEVVHPYSAERVQGSEEFSTYI
jgi:hypothetical protein